MTAQDALPFAERMRIVARLTEINSLHLKGEGKRGAIAIALNHAETSAASDVDSLTAQLAMMDAELEALENERAALNAALARDNAALRR